MHERLLSELQLVMRCDFTSATLFLHVVIALCVSTHDYNAENAVTIKIPKRE